MSTNCTNMHAQAAKAIEGENAEIDSMQSFTQTWKSNISGPATKYSVNRGGRGD